MLPPAANTRRLFAASYAPPTSRVSSLGAAAPRTAPNGANVADGQTQATGIISVGE